MAATQQMIPALNTMIDVTSTRLAGEKAKVPESILVMLFFLALISAFFIAVIQQDAKDRLTGWFKLDFVFWCLYLFCLRWIWTDPEEAS
nr:hypothetical protein [uncultured Flavobacterium sp.]